MSLAPANMRVVEILWEQWITQNFSISAFRSSKIKFDTTSKLITAGESQNRQTILDTLQEISDFHTHLLEDILQFCDTKIRSQLITYAKDLFEEYKSNSLQSDLSSCQEISDYMLWIWEKAFSLLSVWEIIAAKVFTKYLKLHWIPAVYVDTLQLQHINPKDLGSRVGTFLQSEFQRIYSWDNSAIPIIPWYLGWIQWWILDLLGRWYTDYTWERAAMSLHDSWEYDDVLFYIQKMYGFKSTDPWELEDASRAKAVNRLSYALTKRAIVKKWAWAGLINENALSRDIIARKIKILVGNPTDNSDIALISEDWNPNSTGVELVLWRPYNSEYDDDVYNRRNRCSQNHRIVYLMWDNIQWMWDIYARAMTALGDADILDIAWESRLQNPKEMSFVFKTHEEARRAQEVLHAEFIEW